MSKTGRSVRFVAIAAIATAAVVAGGEPVQAADTKGCGSVLVYLPQGEGSASQVRATRVSCRRARSVARACVRGDHDGWKVEADARHDRDYDYSRTVLRRGSSVVSLESVGGGGCLPRHVAISPEPQPEPAPEPGSPPTSP